MNTNLATNPTSPIELIVTVDDDSMLKDIKHAIKMLKGVSKITIKQNDEKPNETTRKAIEADRSGDLIYCDSFEDYLNKVK